MAKQAAKRDPRSVTTKKGPQVESEEEYVEGLDRELEMLAKQVGSLEAKKQSAILDEDFTKASIAKNAIDVRKKQMERIELKKRVQARKEMFDTEKVLALELDASDEERELWAKREQNATIEHLTQAKEEAIAAEDYVQAAQFKGRLSIKKGERRRKQKLEEQGNTKGAKGLDDYNGTITPPRHKKRSKSNSPPGKNRAATGLKQKRGAKNGTLFAQNHTILRSSTHPGNAHLWSQLHVLSNVTKPVGRVAVIITGMLRVDSEHHLNTLGSALQGCDSFVVTYQTYAFLARRISKNTLILNGTEVQKKLPPSIWQWYSLKAGLLHWKRVLYHDGAYHTIVRYRTDMSLPDNFVFTSCIAREGIVYASSDMLFYTNPTSFYRAFSTMYDASVNLYRRKELSPAESELFRSIVRNNDGMRPSCMRANEYAPEPRLKTLNINQHANTRFFRDKYWDRGPELVGARRRLKTIAEYLEEEKTAGRAKAKGKPQDSCVTTKQGGTRCDSKRVGVNPAQSTRPAAPAHTAKEGPPKKPKPRSSDKGKKSEAATVRKQKNKDGEQKTKKAVETSRKSPAKKIEKEQSRKPQISGTIQEGKTSKKPKKRVEGASNETDTRLYCGCKFGLLGPSFVDRAGVETGWRRVRVKKDYQSEPAMSYHLLVHNLSCLPMDLPHREAFALYDDRKEFTFGVDGAMVQPSNWAALQEPEEVDDDNDDDDETGYKDDESENDDDGEWERREEDDEDDGGGDNDGDNDKEEEEEEEQATGDDEDDRGDGGGNGHKEEEEEEEEEEEQVPGDDEADTETDVGVPDEYPDVKFALSALLVALFCVLLLFLRKLRFISRLFKT